MIRAFSENDTDAVLDIWLSASIKAHDFVAPEFWRSQLENMRTIYLPASEVWVAIEAEQVVGFFALLDDRLAAIFVMPNRQGIGFGKSLLTHAKTLRSNLSLTVYKANSASVKFYTSQGFVIVSEGLDAATGKEELTMQWKPGTSFTSTPAQRTI